MHVAGTYSMTLIAAPIGLGVTKTVPFQLKLVNICESTKFYSQTIADLGGFK